MALSYVEYTATGSTQNFTVTFPYLGKAHVSVLVNGLSVPFTWISASSVHITPTVVNGDLVRVQRITPQTPLADSSDGAVLTNSVLQTISRQAIYVSQEVQDAGTETYSDAVAVLAAAQYAAASSTGAHPWINVLDCGAVGDGVANDTAAFASALLDGRPVIVDASLVYKISDLQILASTTCPGIFSVGGQARLIPASSANVRMMWIKKTTGFVIDGLFFDMPPAANGTTAPLCGRAIEIATSVSPYIFSNIRIENCRFTGGTSAITAIGVILKNSRIAKNYVNGTWSDGISLNAVQNVEIVDNVLEDGGSCTTSSSPAGAIRTGTNTQLDATLNLTISRNQISRYCVPTNQSAIDCYSGAARNILVSDNVLQENGGGIEMKTSPWTGGTGTPDKYDAISILGNSIRVRGGTAATTAISLLHADVGDTQGKAENIKIGGNHISTASPATSGSSSIGISVLGYDHVTIDSNTVLNLCRGIELGGSGPTNDTADDIVVTNNTIDCVDLAISRSTGTNTINGLVVRNNPLLRCSAAFKTAVQFAGGTTDDLEITGNRIESAHIGIELRDTDGGLVSLNTIVSGSSCILTQGTAPNNLKIIKNTLVSSGAIACNLGVGTAIVVQNNDVDIGVTFRTVAGSGTYTTAGNCRGMVSADPTATTSGTRGDYFDNSAPAAAGYDGWICTQTGVVGVAVWKGRGLIEA